MEETWLYHYDSETKEQSMKWREKAHPAPKFSDCKIPRKIFASIFCDPGGMLLIDYISRSQTINVEYYLSLLVKLTNILREKLQVKFWKKILFLHENAPAHQTVPKQKKLAHPGCNYMIAHPVHRTWAPRATTC